MLPNLAGLEIDDREHLASKQRFWRIIGGLRDAAPGPNFRAEVSYLKAQEENEGSTDAKEPKDPKWGMKGTIRVDVYENTQKGTVCVYDIKTGRSGLSKARVPPRELPGKPTVSDR